MLENAYLTDDGKHVVIPDNNGHEEFLEKEEFLACYNFLPEPTSAQAKINKAVSTAKDEDLDFLYYTDTEMYYNTFLKLIEMVGIHRERMGVQNGLKKGSPKVQKMAPGYYHSWSELNSKTDEASRKVSENLLVIKNLSANFGFGTLLEKNTIFEPDRVTEEELMNLLYFKKYFRKKLTKVILDHKDKKEAVPIEQLVQETLSHYRRR